MATKDNFFKTSDELYIYYEVHGEGKPIVFLPGFKMSTLFWRHSVEALKDKYKIVLMDLRGHGRSMKVAGNNKQKRAALDVKELIDHLGLSDVLLVGHSLGGATAATYANITNEYKLRGLVMVDATMHGFSDEEWNHHGGNHYNIDGWLKKHIPYMTDFAGSSKIKNPKLSEEDAKNFETSSLQLPPWVGLEYHYDTYMTDNMTPMKDRTIPVATFVTHSNYHDAWESGHEAVKRAVNSPLAICYEYTESGMHAFPVIEKEKFNADLLDFDKKIEELKK